MSWLRSTYLYLHSPYAFTIYHRENFTFTSFSQALMRSRYVSVPPASVPHKLIQRPSVVTIHPGSLEICSISSSSYSMRLLCFLSAGRLVEFRLSSLARVVLLRHFPRVTGRLSCVSVCLRKQRNLRRCWLDVKEMFCWIDVTFP